jgi:hypothetical protein
MSSVIENQKLAATVATLTTGSGIMTMIEHWQPVLSFCATAAGLFLSLVLLIINVMTLRDRLRGKNVAGTDA